MKKVSYRVVLGGFRREKMWEASVKVLEDMRRKGVGPDEVSVSLAMEACTSAHQPRRAQELFREVREQGGVSLCIYPLSICYYCGS
ncbi:unnamed protein product, partial [Discosporangium mesarthrocarpum]